MYRVRLCKLKRSSMASYQIRATCGTFRKVLAVREANEQYELIRRMKELMFDLLYAQFGKDYRRKWDEHRKSLDRSIVSAVKRMR